MKTFIYNENIFLHDKLFLHLGKVDQRDENFFYTMRFFTVNSPPHFLCFLDIFMSTVYSPPNILGFWATIIFLGWVSDLQISAHDFLQKFSPCIHHVIDDFHYPLPA